MRKKGFALIEVLLSIMLIGILIATICSINLSAAKIKAMSRKKDEAFNIARGVCEMFKSERREFKEDDYKTLYKPVNSIDEIESIEGIFKNEVESCNSLNIATAKNKKYVVMINLSKKIAAGITKGSTPNIDILNVQVYIMGENTITMTAVR